MNFHFSVANTVGCTKNSKFPGLAADIQFSYLAGNQISRRIVMAHVPLVPWPEMTTLLDTWSPNEVSSVENVSLVGLYHQLEVHGECFLLAKGIKGVARFPEKKQNARVLRLQWRSGQGASVWLTGPKYNEQSHLSRDHRIGKHECISDSIAVCLKVKSIS